jgi:dTMP kinase
VIAEATKTLKKNKDLTPKTFSLLHAADMMHRYDNEIKPALDKDKIVVCDRYLTTSYVRDTLRGISKSMLDSIYAGVRKPDILFHCVAPTDVAFARNMGAKDLSHYSSGMDMHLGDTKSDSCMRYLKLCDHEYKEMLPDMEGYQRINTNASIKHVFQAVKDVVKDRLKLEKKGEAPKGFRDCTGWGLSGSIAAAAGCKRQDNKTWVPAKNYKKLKTTMKEIKEDLKRWQSEKTAGHIAVDFDGTLARRIKWKGNKFFGSPVPEMVRRLKRWKREGTAVKIFTARASNEESRKLVQDWLKEHVGFKLPVTNVKSPHMTKFYDDKAVHIRVNTGRRALDIQKDKLMKKKAMKSVEQIVQMFSHGKLQDMLPKLRAGLGRAKGETTQENLKQLITSLSEAPEPTVLADLPKRPFSAPDPLVDVPKRKAQSVSSLLQKEINQAQTPASAGDIGETPKAPAPTVDATLANPAPLHKDPAAYVLAALLGGTSLFSYPRVKEEMKKHKLI